MKDKHYELKDYTIIKEKVDYAYSLLVNEDKDAFIYITHNLYDLLNEYNPDFAIKVYNNFKQLQIKFEDDDENVFELAKEKYSRLFDEYLNNIIVDINEHHGY